MNSAILLLAAMAFNPPCSDHAVLQRDRDLTAWGEDVAATWWGERMPFDKESNVEIVELAKACGRTGEPFLRSLEYEFPHQGSAAVKDQFMIGDFHLVAPQLEKGAANRAVEIPGGTWVRMMVRRLSGRGRSRYRHRSTVCLILNASKPL